MREQGLEIGKSTFKNVFSHKSFLEMRLVFFALVLLAFYSCSGTKHISILVTKPAAVNVRAKDWENKAYVTSGKRREMQYGYVIDDRIVDERILHQQ